MEVGSYNVRELELSTFGVCRVEFAGRRQQREPLRGLDLSPKVDSITPS